VLDLFGVEHALATPWDGNITAPEADKTPATGAPLLRVHR
jgi:hypothetical protein